eukprot:scaffold13166_cov114-Isochrysis_galbana.AAC.3
MQSCAAASFSSQGSPASLSASSESPDDAAPSAGTPKRCAAAAAAAAVPPWERMLCAVSMACRRRRDASRVMYGPSLTMPPRRARATADGGRASVVACRTIYHSTVWRRHLGVSAPTAPRAVRESCLHSHEEDIKTDTLHI